MSDKFINASGLGAIRTWILNKLGAKQDIVSNPTANNVLTTNSSGQAVDSGVAIDDVQNIFYARYSVTTESEIREAINDGKIIVITGNGLYVSTLANTSYSNRVELTTFNHISSNRIYGDVFTIAGSTWTQDSVSIEDATSSAFGLIKLNPSESITLNSNGQLDVGGRLGQMSNTTGIYSPKTINPSSVGNGSLLITEASGLTLGPKSLAVVTGNGVSLKTAAAAGATSYVVKNTYENKIYCAGLVGATIAKDEASAAETFVTVTNVTADGYNPSSNGYWSSEADIIITTNKSINPNSSISSIRAYYTSTGFSNMTAGQMVGHKGGASVAVGQRVFAESGNACVLVGASIYNKGNGNAVFGRQHISKKNRSFLAGTGHDTTNGPSEGVAALGQWSDIKSDTSFAIGNGTSATARSNSFEIDTAGDAFFDGYIVLKSPNGTQYKVSVDDSGNLVTSTL